jgi:hypothetical protein
VADPNFALLHRNYCPDYGCAGQFVLVEGEVLSVRENDATIYSNLGRHWTRDFAVTISKRLDREFAPRASI